MEMHLSVIFPKIILNSLQDSTFRARNTCTSQGQSQEIFFQEEKPKAFNEKAYQYTTLLCLRTHLVQ